MKPEKCLYPPVTKKPIHVVGDWEPTYKFTIQEIALILSRIYRYSACSNITVLQHSYALAEFFFYGTQYDQQKRARLALVAMLHDAHEAYYGDVSLPMKIYVTPDHDARSKLCQSYIESALLPQFSPNALLWCRLMVADYDKAIVVEEIQHKQGLNIPYPEGGRQEFSSIAVEMVRFFDRYDAFSRSRTPKDFVGFYHMLRAYAA